GLASHTRRRLQTRLRNPGNMRLSSSEMNSGNSARSAQWLNRFAWITCVATLFLICSGGMVTSKGVGLAVPDWPTTFGYNMFLFPAAKWVGGILFEHTHRLIASAVGFLTIILAIWLWRSESRNWVRNLGVLALGATMRHQHRDLAILDFPTANGGWIPDTSSAALAKINAWRDARGLSDEDAFQVWLQMAHRFLALIIAIIVVAFCLRIWRDAPGVAALKRLSITWVALVVCQIALGAWTIWSDKAADVATAHVAAGAIMLSFGVSICAICWRILQGQRNERPAMTTFESEGAVPV